MPVTGCDGPLHAHCSCCNGSNSANRKASTTFEITEDLMIGSGMKRLPRMLPCACCRQDAGTMLSQDCCKFRAAGRAIPPTIDLASYLAWV